MFVMYTYFMFVYTCCGWLNFLHYIVDRIPDELNNLRTVEKRMISIFIPYKKFYQRRSVRGNAMCFPHAEGVRKLIKSLPHNCDEQSLYLYIIGDAEYDNRMNPCRYKDYYSFRPKVVKSALDWLQKHNLWYRNIQIRNVYEDISFKNSIDDNDEHVCEIDKMDQGKYSL